MSAIALFSHIEQQLNALRATALQSLEEKVLPRKLCRYTLPNRADVSCRALYLRLSRWAASLFLAAFRMSHSA